MGWGARRFLDSVTGILDDFVYLLHLARICGMVCGHDRLFNKLFQSFDGIAEPSLIHCLKGIASRNWLCRRHLDGFNYMWRRGHM